MAYVVLADFRTATLQEWTAGLALSTNEAPDAQITAAITEMSNRFDSWTADHFADDTGDTTFLVDSIGGRDLYMPRRVRTVTQVDTRGFDGTFLTQPAASYRLQSSLNAAGSAMLNDRFEDCLSVVEGYFIIIVSPAQHLNWYSWPKGKQIIRVTGTFDWLVTPSDVKRAVSLMVWDRFKPMNDLARRSRTYSTAEASFTFDATQPSGIPEVDEIVEFYSNEPATLVH